ncbi:Dynamitin-domain-containing protein [Sporodiniella umbellata]|nr:Dynamitin-domain-containing protein [Sporodiniella umbellata]
MNQQIGEVDENQRSNYTSQIDEAKALIKQLEAYKQLSSEPLPPKSETALASESKPDMVTYELFYTPEISKLQKESSLSDIDDRIAKIEKLIGSSSGQTVEDLPASLSSTSLIHSLTKLEQQIVLLAQPRQLEMVARRVKVLNSDLDRLNELKAGRKDMSLGFNLSSALTGAAHNAVDTKDNSNDTETKINQLFSTLEKIDPLLNLTPALLTRLKALQGLHAEAATFGQSIKVISEEQTRMTDELKSLTETCAQLNNSLKMNEEAIDGNIKIIDTRMTDLIQRVTALTTTSPAPKSPQLETVPPIETQEAS